VHRSTAGAADGLVSAPGVLAAQPASRTAESATAERAANGLMRTVNLKTNGKGESPSSPMFALPPLGNRHADEDMDSGVPSNG
jgi:hypothetical protein